MSDNGLKAPDRPLHVDRILVATKYRFIGDTLLAVPLLRAIHDTWPAAAVCLVTGAKAREALLHCPYLDEIIEFDPYRQCDKGVSRYLQLISDLRQKSFDLAFVCNRSFHSALTAALAGAKERVGWSGFEGRDFLLTSTTPYDGDATEVSSYLDLLRKVAPGSSLSSDLELWVDDGEREQASRNLLPSSLWIGLQPGATHPEKQWPVDHYRQLAWEILQAHPDARFALVGGPDEIEQALAFLQNCDRDLAERTVNLAGRLSLRETLALLTHLDVFVAGDTAIRHCSIALDTPSIALFGPTSVRKWGNECHPKHVTIVAPDNRVGSISVVEVYQACTTAFTLRHTGVVRGLGMRVEV